MFILIPAIIIFLLVSYIYLNDVSLAGQVAIYTVAVSVALFFFFLYKALKKDFTQQEIHRLEADIAFLEKKLLDTADQTGKEQIQSKIKQLQDEIALKLQNK